MDKLTLMSKKIQKCPRSGASRPTRRSIANLPVCAICLDKVILEISNMQYNLLVCGHYFHDGCIEKWTERVQQCPICRTAITEITLNVDNIRRIVHLVNPYDVNDVNENLNNNIFDLSTIPDTEQYNNINEEFDNYTNNEIFDLSVVTDNNIYHLQNEENNMFEQYDDSIISLVPLRRIIYSEQLRQMSLLSEENMQ